MPTHHERVPECPSESLKWSYFPLPYFQTKNLKTKINKQTIPNTQTSFAIHVSDFQIIFEPIFPDASKIDTYHFRVLMQQGIFNPFRPLARGVSGRWQGK